MIQQFLFEATDAYGRREQNAVVASDVADARLQLERMGYSAIRVESGDLMPFRRRDKLIADAAPVSVQSRFDPMWLAVLKSYGRNWKWWAPGTLVLATSAWTGAPLWIGGALLAGGLVMCTTVTLPMVLYQQVQTARAEGRWTAGLRYHALFRRVDFARAIDPMLIDADEAKLLAGSGQLEQALENFSVHAGGDEVPYLTQLASIYDCAGRRDLMLATQRRALAARPDSAELRIDVAWSLIRYTSKVEEARQLMRGIDDKALNELGKIAAATVDALLAQADGAHDQALAMMMNVDDDMSAYSNPLLVATRRALHGYMAVSLKAIGQTGEAHRMWADAEDLLRAHGYHQLIERYESAA